MTSGRPPVPTLEPSRRPLTDAERRLLDAKIRDLESRLNRGPNALVPVAIGTGVLWILTLLASDTAWPIVTGFWIVVGTGLYLWVRRDLTKNLDALREMRHAYESARRRNEAEVYEVKASGFAEFEEFEDEGACYAFQLDDDRLVFVVGQQFYPEGRFPSHDFSLVYILDERDFPADEVIEKRGPRAEPTRTIPAATKLRLEIPEHLEVRHGRLDQLEEMLST